MSIGSKWRNHKHELRKKIYKLAATEPLPKIISAGPKGVASSQWVHLVNDALSSNGIEASKKAKYYRSHQKMEEEHGGPVLAVKKIDSSFFQGGRRPEFSEIISNISKLRHLNIAELVGYCSEQGQNRLVWDYFRNGSLHEFLHMSDEFSKLFTWNTRIRIALRTALAVEYLHEVCSPSCVHKNIKSSNILLDAELNPHLSDCGLAIFHERTSQNLGTGYNAPECTKPSAYTLKGDVYSFRVVYVRAVDRSLHPSHAYCCKLVIRCPTTYYSQT